MSTIVTHIESSSTAVIANERVAHFGDPTREYSLARGAETKCPLLSIGVIAIRGADALNFTNAQFTTDCGELSTDQSQLSAWCDPKGRVLFTFTLYRDGEDVYAILPKTRIGVLLKRLQMYVLRANVRLEDISSTMVAFGLTGEFGDPNLDPARLAQPWASTQLDLTQIAIRYGPGSPRFLVLVPENAAVKFWGSLDRPPIGEDSWTALDCEAGLPHVDEQTSGEYLPQNLNLDALQGLSYAKGCYPGQEIIARVKYRGEVKKRLISVTIDAPVELTSGSVIHASGTERAVGNILYAQTLGTQKTLATAIVETKYADAELLSDNQQLQRHSLAYAIE